MLCLGKKFFDSLDNVVSRNAIYVHEHTSRPTAGDPCHGKTTHTQLAIQICTQDTRHCLTKSTYIETSLQIIHTPAISLNTHTLGVVVLHSHHTPASGSGALNKKFLIEGLESEGIHNPDVDVLSLQGLGSLDSFLKGHCAANHSHHILLRLPHYLKQQMSSYKPS